MVTKKVEEALNRQLGVELESAYVYLSMSACAEAMALPGFATWFRVQTSEEYQHAMKFFDFINDRGGRVTLQAIPKPPTEWSTPLQLFEDSLERERKVSKAIDQLYELVAKERDFASQALLDWFATEQVEEEKVVTQIIDDLRRIGSAGDALYLLDKELGARASAPAA